MNNQDNNKINIENYIKDKEKLLSALGVFLALTLFFQDNKIIEKNSNLFLDNILSCIFFTISILIWFELWVSFPKKNTTLPLRFFEFLTNIASTYIICIWLENYLKIGLILLSIFIFPQIFYFIKNMLMRKSN